MRRAVRALSTTTLPINSTFTMRRAVRALSTTTLPIKYIHDGPGLPAQLYQTAPDTYLADVHTLWTPPGARGVYGGHVLATSMLAAERSLPAGCTFPMNSLHGYFLRPGKSELPTTYSVENLRNGRSFITRAVTARQGGEAIFTLQCSFHALEVDASGGAMGHQVAMPAVPLPQELLAAEAAAAPAAAPAMQLPLRILRCHPQAPSARAQPTWPARQLAWMAMAPLPPPSPATAHLHRAALAFAADWGIGVTSLLPYNLSWNSRHLAIAASLDHSMHFHDPMSGQGASAVGGEGPGSSSSSSSSSSGQKSAIQRHPDAPMVPLPGTAPPQRADAYVLFDMESSLLRSGRGMNTCRMWSQDGTLLCTAAQESLLRAR